MMHNIHPPVGHNIAVNSSTQSGFTLIELLITMVTAAIIITVAIPSFGMLIAKTSMSYSMDEFETALNYTKSEAVKRNSYVTICKSNDGSACTKTGGWEQGWLIFEEHSSNNGELDTGEDVLRVHGNLPTGLSLKGVSSGNNIEEISNYVTYLPTGQSPHTGRWGICIYMSSIKPRVLTLTGSTGRLGQSKENISSNCEK